MRSTIYTAAMTALLTGAAMLQACSEAPQTSETDVVEVSSEPELILTDEARSEFDNMTPEELVESLKGSGGVGPDGEYVDALLVVKLQTLTDAEAATFERQVPRGTDSFRYAFQAAGRALIPVS